MHNRSETVLEQLEHDISLIFTTLNEYEMLCYFNASCKCTCHTNNKVMSEDRYRKDLTF